MKNFHGLCLECMEELDALNVQYGKISKWEINTRAKKRWGQ